jgi:hypothetical protein
VMHLPSQQRPKALADWMVHLLSTTSHTAALILGPVMAEYSLDELLNRVDPRLHAQFD